MDKPNNDEILLVLRGQAFDAIKLWRTRTGEGLKEALKAFAYLRVDAGPCDFCKGTGRKKEWPTAATVEA